MPDDRHIHTGRKFRLVKRTIEHPDGVHEYDVIVHPGAAVILPFLDERRVLLERVFRAPFGREMIEVPAGTLDGDEPPQEAAARELAEETGYRAGVLEPLCVFESTPGICDEVMHVFVARDLTPGEQALEHGEHITLLEMDFDEALAAVQRGEIGDAKTVIALLYYDRFVRRV